MIVRKAGEMRKGQSACLTCCWEVQIGTEMVRISFSRDILHVWISGNPVETTAFISDQQYDVDLDFEIHPGCYGHIFSDVDDSRTEIKNYLFINENETPVAETVLTYKNNMQHFKNIRK